jgi:dephospho-CoA kinase
MNKPLQIGITGGIGSGKSIVCKVFATLGIPIYDADSRAKWLMNHSFPLKTRLIEAFGEDCYTKTGELNRSFIASQVFNDSGKVTILNSLVHPAVGLDYLQWLDNQVNNINNSNYHKNYVLREAALMIESGSHKNLDELITISCPLEIRIQRIKQRDPQRSEIEIRAIIDKQLPEAEKIRLSDHVIYNDDEQLVIPQILKIDTYLQQKSLHRNE